MPESFSKEHQVLVTRSTWGRNAFLGDRKHMSVSAESVASNFDRACIEISKAIKVEGLLTQPIDVISTLSSFFEMRPSGWRPAELDRRLKNHQRRDASYALDAIRKEVKRSGFSDLTESMAANIAILKMSFGSTGIMELDELDAAKLGISETGIERLTAAISAFGADCPSRESLRIEAGFLHGLETSEGPSLDD